MNGLGFMPRKIMIINKEITINKVFSDWKLEKAISVSEFLSRIFCIILKSAITIKMMPIKEIKTKIRVAEI